MTNHARPQVAAEQVPCEVCHKEIPLSEADHFEAQDYVAHFCGFECYTIWKQRSEALLREQKEAGL